MTTITIDRATVAKALDALEHLAKIKCDHGRGLCACEYREAATALRTALEQPAPSVEPFAWITHESVYRLQKGGNHKGTVPVHKVRSHTAKIPVHITVPVIRTVEHTDG